jgi:hypothetical protein
MVAPLIIAAGVAAAAQLASSYMGQAQAAKTEKERRKLLEQAAAEFNKIPDPQQRNDAFAEIARTSPDLIPAMESVVQLSETNMKGVSTDPRLKEAQYAALAKLGQLSEGGMDTKDLADIERAKQQYRAENASQQSAIQEGMARRGIASSGMEAISRQQAAQGAADQMLGYEQQVQGDAQRRALEAIMQRGALSGQMRGQDFSEQERIAAAKDAVARFNAGQSADVGARNIAAQRQAQMYNTAEAQRIADANVATRNASQQAQNALAQQQFNNQLARTSGATGMQTNVSNVLGQEAAGTRQMYAGIGQGAGQLGAAYIGSQGRTKKTAEDEEDINA